MQRKISKHQLQTRFVYFLFISFFLTGQLSFAAETTASNLTGFSYPSHECGSKPAPPGKPPVLISSIDVDAHNILVAQYNIRVTIYNKQIKSYKACINDFIKKGNDDMNVIKKQLDAALKEARANN